MNAKRLQEIKARLAAATPGPGMVAIHSEASHEETVKWFARVLDFGTSPIVFLTIPVATETQPDPPITAITGNGPTSEENAEFYAHAWQDIADLLEVVEETFTYE